ncbi:MAG TPA: hypothetical protein VLJ21_05250 [Candidatus Binatia bacterium]|nr:hypothetical protein [Candidatus Binatia bacterium]
MADGCHEERTSRPEMVPHKVDAYERQNCRGTEEQGTRRDGRGAAFSESRALQKRAQIIGQVFILILAAAIFILILLYGYKAISQFTQRSEQVAFVNFETEFRNAVKGVSLDYGSVKKLDLTLPTRYQELCVLCSPGMDAKAADCRKDNPALGTFQTEHPLVFESAQGNAQNVFLIPLAETPILLDHVEAANGAFCTKILEGKVTLRLEGKGDRALVSPWLAQ